MAYACAINSSLNVRFTLDALNAFSNSIACCPWSRSSSVFRLNNFLNMCILIRVGANRCHPI